MDKMQSRVSFELNETPPSGLSGDATPVLSVAEQSRRKRSRRANLTCLAWKETRSVKTKTTTATNSATFLSFSSSRCTIGF